MVRLLLKQTLLNDLNSEDVYLYNRWSEKHSGKATVGSETIEIPQACVIIL